MIGKLNIKKNDPILNDGNKNLIITKEIKDDSLSQIPIEEFKQIIENFNKIKKFKIKDDNVNL